MIGTTIEDILWNAAFEAEEDTIELREVDEETENKSLLEQSAHYFRPSNL